MWDFANENLVMLMCSGMFAASSLLRWSGGTFKDEARARDPETRKLIVLLHGLGGQEGQYCMGRIHLALADSQTPLPPAVSVNYHTKGMYSTSFTKDQDLKTFTEIVAQQLEPYAPGSKGQNVEKVELIFVGHSCGCLVSAYFAQHHAERMGFTVPLIVACSAPYQGSNILTFLARDGPWFVRKCVDTLVPGLHKKIFEEMQVGSPVLADLQQGIREMRGRGLQVRCITGSLDPLVRPWSAAFDGTDDADRNLVRMFHCGHFNNAISLSTWQHQIAWIVEHCTQGIPST